MTEQSTSKNISETYDDYYKGAVSDHFDGTQFFNPWNPKPKKGLWDVLKWRMEGNRADWPDFVDIPEKPAPEPVSDALKVTYIGHASFLLQVKGKNILIDPVFSMRASPFGFAGPKRVTNPAFSMESLPDIHAVFVSHNHYDHMDLASLSWLASNKKPHFYTPLGNPRLIKLVAGDQPITAMDWHDRADLGDGVSLTLTPSQHWSRRSFSDTNRDLWGGCVVESGGHCVYFAGDTGFHSHVFEDIHKRHGAPDIALLPIGAYAPRWFMAYAHMNPEDAISAHKILKAKKSMGFHFEVFQLTDEGFDDPRKRTVQMLDIHKIADNQFLIPAIGDHLFV